MVPDDDRIAPEVSQKPEGAVDGLISFSVPVELAGGDLGTVHLVHGPDVVEKVSGPEPGIRL